MSQRNKNYTVFWKDGNYKTFDAKTPLSAYVRALSYSLVTNERFEISHVIDELEGKIYYNWFWDISYSMSEQKNYNPTSNVTYTEDEVECILLNYARYVGNSKDHAIKWFDWNKKQ